MSFWIIMSLASQMVSSMSRVDSNKLICPKMSSYVLLALLLHRILSLRPTSFWRCQGMPESIHCKRQNEQIIGYRLKAGFDRNPEALYPIPSWTTQYWNFLLKFPRTERTCKIETIFSKQPFSCLWKFIKDPFTSYRSFLFEGTISQKNLPEVS